LANSNPDENEKSFDGEDGVIPTSVRIARWLFVLLGLIWLIFGISSITRLSTNGGNISGLMSVFIATLMFVNSVVLIWIGWGIGRGQRVYYYFGLLALAGNIFLTLTDEFGLFDILVLILAVVLFILLVFTRSKYLHS
jgi:hypothetical protein